MKKTILTMQMTSAFALLLATGASQAAVTLTHYYSLGEAGTAVTDSVGSSDFTGNATSSIVGASGAAGSTSYVSFAGGNALSGADFSGMGSTNFAVSVWVRTTTAITTARNDSHVFNGNFAITGGAALVLSNGSDQSDNDAWAGTVNNISWVGPARGVEDSATQNTWVQLAWINDGGTNDFYINGIIQSGGTDSNAVIWSNGPSSSLGSTNANIDFDVDDLRIYTIAPGDTAATLAAMSVAVPEPSSAVLLGLGGLALILRRRK